MARWIVGVVLVAGALVSREAHAVVVDRVVAVVGDRPILASEVRARARPEVAVALARGSAVESAVPTIERAMLDRMIDERLFEQEAGLAHVVVTPAQIDVAVRDKAASLGLTVPALLEIAARQGFSEADYRDEVRRQLLEGRVLQLRVAGRIRVTESDAYTAYGRFVTAFAEARPVELDVMAVRASVAPRPVLLPQVDAIVQRTRAGAALCTAARSLPAATCGATGAKPLAEVHPTVRAAIAALAARDVTGPLEIDDAIAVVQVDRWLAPPSFEQVRDEMLERATEDALLRERDRWLGEQRRRTHVEVRW